MVKPVNLICFNLLEFGQSGLFAGMTTAALTTYPWQQQPVDLAPLAPVVYLGWQEGCGSVQGFHLWNLTEAIPGHSEGSSVNGATLERLGFRLPPVPCGLA